MANELQPLSQLFQNKLFRIPDYQRGYAWQQPQLVDFWDDLINLQEDRYHYTGLLSLKNLKRRETASWGSDLWLVELGYRPCHIVDGQQRLTTFVILLNEIVTFVRNLPENKGKADTEIVLGYEVLSGIVEKYICRKRPPHGMITTYLFGYEVDNPSAEYLRYKVFCENHSGSVNETYYTKNLKFAKSFFADNIAALYASEGIDSISQLYRKLTLRLMFNIHEIDDDYDVFVAFETMNNRGKKLTNLELLKNRLIYLTTLYGDDKCDQKDKEALRKLINDAWKEVYFQLGRNENTPLSDDEFLRAHWIIYFAYSRKKGDDYIRFLLRKFSAKNIFEKKHILTEDVVTFASGENDGDDDDFIEAETAAISKLEPIEIRDYVNSLMDMAKFWYDTYFPYESQIITDEEKRWIDRLNRVGIGHFRPLVAVVLSRAKDNTAETRLAVFKAIERFLFVCFRLAAFNASYRSSEYYRATRSIYLGQMSLEEITQDINRTVDADMGFAISNFVTRIEKRFESGDGYYGWNSLRYFMFEYEYSLTVKHGIPKITWELFAKTEKDKVSIEHILPQTPTKLYWRNQFRQFTTEEVKSLSGALGNLLPLSQSVNSGLQNDSFEDKKHPQSTGRRGYQDGSHSEIEVSKEADWDANRIYDRSVKLLQFMEQRWNISFTGENLKRLVYVDFVHDGREIPGEVTEDVATVLAEATHEQPLKTDLGSAQLQFWTAFTDYCHANGRGEDIASRKPLAQNWYDIPVGAIDYNLSFTVTRNKYLSLVIYAYNGDAFRRLESKKDAIEASFGHELDWYSSRESSVAKRIVYKREMDIFNTDQQPDIFAWMIAAYDSLYAALDVVGE